MLTFGQYNALVAIRHRLTRDQVASQTNYDRGTVYYYITNLLHSGLIKASDAINDENTFYELTNAGLTCMHDYEASNPELTMNRTINQLKFN